MSQTLLTDRPALLRQRARALRAPALFLQELAADEIEDRLELVNKSFTAPGIVSGFPELWQARFPEAVVVPDEEVLALGPGAHDLVIHALCLHWANDPVGQLVQARRALRPDGLLLAVLFGGGSLQELRAALAQAEADVAGGLSPRVLPMGEIRDLGALLQRAGLALPVADRLPLDLCYPDALALMRDLRAMGEGNAMAARPRGMLRREVLARACEVYAENFAHAQGGIRASAEMIFLAGWAPDPSQPQPLRPGSAVARLADALGTQETPLGD
ncbi:methyltransferase domain-containing protein [Roseovarius autotrophicus]|uniref:methyltransferase domain-containing protein n=1 Tax=Roseovarius autotrophicus TaxID=2824121 RepID=UPI0019E8CFC2|nr:methyltransferase domain-containing protein [Roseovarius autotrophicus]MBE0453739.1 SAM-dependent methyltransferase [Roseovarius sp.]